MGSFTELIEKYFQQTRDNRRYLKVPLKNIKIINNLNKSRKECVSTSKWFVNLCFFFYLLTIFYCLNQIKILTQS